MCLPQVQGTVLQRACRHGWGQGWWVWLAACVGMVSVLVFRSYTLRKTSKLQDGCSLKSMWTKLEERPIAQWTWREPL